MGVAKGVACHVVFSRVLRLHALTNDLLSGDPESLGAQQFLFGRPPHPPLRRCHQPKQFLSQLLSIVRSQPTPAACVAVYQTVRLLRRWSQAREIVQLWEALPSFESCEAARRRSHHSEKNLAPDAATKVDDSAPLPRISVVLKKDTSPDMSVSTAAASTGPAGASGALATAPRESRSSTLSADSDDGDSIDDGAVDIYEPILLFCKADAEASYCCCCCGQFREYANCVVH